MFSQYELHLYTCKYIAAFKILGCGPSLDPSHDQIRDICPDASNTGR